MDADVIIIIVCVLAMFFCCCLPIVMGCVQQFKDDKKKPQYHPLGTPPPYECVDLYPLPIYSSVDIKNSS